MPCNHVVRFKDRGIPKHPQFPGCQVHVVRFKLVRFMVRFKQSAVRVPNDRKYNFS